MNSVIKSLSICILSSLCITFGSCSHSRKPEPVNVLHVTDLFRPHGDPDDHFDLATQFALAKKNLICLKGVVIDNFRNCQPDVTGVAQMNWITGKAVPVGVGCKNEETAVTNGLELIREVLESSPSKVAIHVVGSTSDVAKAANLWPELFSDKVSAVYVNAGSAENNENIEWNVQCNIEAYSKMFSLPCPLYWMPCFQTAGVCNIGKNGTFWRFQQKRVFDRVSDKVLNFFDDVLSRKTETSWFESVNRQVNAENIEKYGSNYRNMWCTAGFLHTAGLTVWKDGSITKLDEKPENEVFRFVPIKATCKSDGRVKWSESETNLNQFIFEVTDTENYQEAMTVALAEVLSWM